MAQCDQLTAKGLPCTKKAMDGNTMCSWHWNLGRRHSKKKDREVLKPAAVPARFIGKEAEYDDELERLVTHRYDLSREIALMRSLRALLIEECNKRSDYLVERTSAVVRTCLIHGLKSCIDLGHEEEPYEQVAEQLTQVILIDLIPLIPNQAFADKSVDRFLKVIESIRKLIETSHTMAEGQVIKVKMDVRIINSLVDLFLKHLTSSDKREAFAKELRSFSARFFPKQLEAPELVLDSGAEVLPAITLEELENEFS